MSYVYMFFHCIVRAVTTYEEIFVKREISFLQNISLYYNNIFAFHMHIFIVFTLILHIFNTIIH